MQHGSFVVGGLIVALTIAHWSAFDTSPDSPGSEQLPAQRSELLAGFARQPQIARTRDFSKTLASLWSEER